MLPHQQLESVRIAGARGCDGIPALIRSIHRRHRRHQRHLLKETAAAKVCISFCLRGDSPLTVAAL
jgi:hypothetical protein